MKMNDIGQVLEKSIERFYDEMNYILDECTEEEEKEALEHMKSQAFPIIHLVGMVENIIENKAELRKENEELEEQE